ncbi:hypothetical protein [Rhodoglobus sp.]
MWLLPNSWPRWFDDFWASPFGAFAGSPNDAVPTAIAVIALIIATVALIRSIALTPKPDMRLTVYSLLDTTVGAPTSESPAYLLNVSVLNRGEGLALDVMVSVKPRSRKLLIHELGSVATDETKRHQFELRMTDRAQRKSDH